MKIIGVIQIDLQVSPLGTKSRLADEILGSSVLRRTVQRVLQAESWNQLILLAPVNQKSKCESMVSDLPVRVQPFDAKSPTWCQLVQTARKWSLDGWRGGLGGSTYFDEFIDAGLVSGLLKTESAQAVFFMPPAAPVLDPGLIDAMINHHREMQNESKLTFTSAPPGVAGIILDHQVIQDLAEKNIPVGWLLSYKPDNPQKDLFFQPCLHEIPLDLRYATGRLMADTKRSFDRVTALLQDHPDPGAALIGRWLLKHEIDTVEPFPREIEIELTTDDPFPEALLRPRGKRITPRGPMEVKLVEQIIEQASAYDDTLIVLGGHGDPLRHPSLPRLLKRIREVGGDHVPYGLALRTAGVDLTDALTEAIVAAGVDVVEVTLDAWSPDLYAKLQSPNDPSLANLGWVLDRLETLTAVRNRHQTIKPIMVPAFTKSLENVHELDAFHDGWLRKNGVVSITGFSHCAKQVEDRSVMKMAPSPRITCRRLRSRAMVLADGRMTLCDQDIHGKYALGHLADESLESLWQGSALTQLRESHHAQQFDQHSLCSACDEWHRP